MLNVEHQGAELELYSAGHWQPVGEVTRATEEKHRKEVWPQHLAHVEEVIVSAM